MEGNLKHINDDAEFQPELTSAGPKLVVVDFFADWYNFVRFSNEWVG